MQFLASSRDHFPLLQMLLNSPLIWLAVNCRYASSKCARKVRREHRIKGAYFTSGRTHVMHTTVTTQQFQTSAVSFGFFLDASFTAETEQTRGRENSEWRLGFELWCIQ